MAPDATAAAAESARAAFERTPLFQRTAGNPNIHRFEALIHKHATLQKLDPALVKAVIAVESSFEPDAVSGERRRRADADHSRDRTSAMASWATPSVPSSRSCAIPRSTSAWEPATCTICWRCSKTISNSRSLPTTPASRP